jgi:hypothetical protein
MKNINTSQDVYAFNFGEALKIIINNLMNSDFECNKNLGAPFSFNENNLRKHFSDCIENINLNNLNPKLIIERNIDGDLKSINKRHGGTDYFYVNKSCDTYHHSDVLATFEVKGPTRPSLLKGSKVNWYPKIITDIKKQMWRNLNFSNCSNYIVLLIKSNDIHTHNQVMSLYKVMEDDITGVNLDECFWESIFFRSSPLHISIARVSSI